MFSDLEPLPADLLDGTPYVAGARIGVGGMGEVVEARHRALGTRVVVKLLREELAGDPGLVERMVVEARALAALDEHPHVVGVRDFGRTARGVPFLVLEALRGTTLADELLARGPLPVLEAIQIARQVLAALAAAHQQGFIHRDVKLQNVFVCRSGRHGEPLVKLLDFGIAKVVADHTGHAPIALVHHTAEGALVGTPRTVAPEQLDPRRVGPATDLYAVGLLLYTLLVGRGPFDHYRKRTDLLRAHREERPRAPSLAGARLLPPALDAVVLRALAKAPEDRFPNAYAMTQALLAAAEETPAPTTGALEPLRTLRTAEPRQAVSPKHHSDALWIAGGLFLLAAACLTMALVVLEHGR